MLVFTQLSQIFAIIFMLFSIFFIFARRLSVITILINSYRLSLIFGNYGGVFFILQLQIIFIHQQISRPIECQGLRVNKIIQPDSKFNITMKGTASVNPIFESYEITNPHVYTIQPLLVTDSHRLYFKNKNNSTKWEHKSVINCCYSEKYGALIILSEEGRLHIFTESLDEIARVPWESKYSVGLQFFDSKSMFLMIGATDIELQYVRIFSNIKSTKFVSSMNFAIEKKDKYIANPQTKLQWNKGYNYNIKENLLYIWSSKDINFYQLDNLAIKSCITSLTRKDLSITYVLFNHHYKYTITGLINGHIKVWRLPQNSLNCSTKDYILIHKYARHSKQIEKIVEGYDQRIIISSSEEMVICLWSLETFQLLRQYDFMSEYSRVFLYNSVYSLAVRDGELGKLKFGKNLQFITDITSEVIAVDKYRKQAKLARDSPVDSVQITLASNLGFQIRNDQLDSKDLNKIEIEYIYPPLKAKGIHQIIANPYQQNQYFLLVENGEIFRLRIQNNSGKIQQSYNIERTKDIQLHQLNQAPTCIKFLNIVPPQFDSQINQNTIQKKEKKEIEEEKAFLELKLIVVGCNKGTVVFLRTYDFQFIYTRVTYHREAIVSLDSFRVNGYSYLVSYCAQNYVKIVRFDHQKATCMFSIFSGDTITFIKGLQDRLALVFKKGFFEVFQLSDQEKDYCIKNSKSSDHEQQILAIDSDPEKKLILTAAADNKIKIWTYYKVLLYQVILDEGLKNAVWFRPLQILVSHNLKLLYFKNIGLKISEREIEEINEKFLVNNEQQEERVSIEDTIKAIKSLKQQIKYEFVEPNKQIPKLPELKIKQSKFSKGNKTTDLHQSYISEGSPKKEQGGQKISQQKKRKTYTIQQDQPKSKIADSDLEAVRKHIDDMNQLRKHTNESVLPKIKPKNEDSFDNFMKSKLINKKILTRRDITLNRIIMKNIIKQHFGADNEITNHLKLDF